MGWLWVFVLFIVWTDWSDGDQGQHVAVEGKTHSSFNLFLVTRINSLAEAGEARPATVANLA